MLGNNFFYCTHMDVWVEVGATMNWPLGGANLPTYLLEVSIEFQKALFLHEH